MNAETVSTPLLCCSAPRPLRIIADRAVPSHRTSFRIAASPIPVSLSTWAGWYESTLRRTASNPVVRISTKSARSALLDGEVEQAVGEGEVGAGGSGQEQVGGPGGRRCVAGRRRRAGRRPASASRTTA